MNGKPLRTWIVHNYGSQRLLSEQLKVTTMTIQNWCNKNPEGILKHFSALKLKDPDRLMDLVDAVMSQKKEIGGRPTHEA